MNKKMLKVFFGCISIAAVCFAMTGCSWWKDEEKKPPVDNVGEIVEFEDYTYKEADGTRVNNSEKITKETKYLDSLEFKNISIRESGSNTHIGADVYNNSEELLTEKEVTIILLNSQNGEVKRINTYIGSIPPKTSVKLNANVTLDFSNVYDIKFIEKK